MVHQCYVVFNVPLYMDAFHSYFSFFDFFCVINLKDYTGSVSCFLNLMKIEPFKDQVLLILYLQV